MSCIVDQYVYSPISQIPVIPYIYHMVAKNIWIAGLYNGTTQEKQYQNLDPTINNVLNFTITGTNIQMSYKFVDGLPTAVFAALSMNTPFTSGPVSTKYPDFMASKLPLQYGTLCCGQSGQSGGSNITEQFSFMKDDGMSVRNAILIALIVLILIGMGYYIFKSTKK